MFVEGNMLWPMAMAADGQVYHTYDSCLSLKQVRKVFNTWKRDFGYDLKHVWIQIYDVRIGSLTGKVEVDLTEYFQKGRSFPEEVFWMTVGVSSGSVTGKAFERYEDAMKTAGAVKEDNDFASMYESGHEDAWKKAFSL